MPTKKKGNRSLTAVSLFSGCGGFDWGVKQGGVRIIWANDIDPHAAAAYKKLFPKVKFFLGDVREVKTFPKADILIGCYPCTGFSTGARRRNKQLDDRNLRSNKNNFLYREFLRAIRHVKPKYLFIENVHGMLSAEDGWFFKQQIRGLRRLGYRISYKMLKASDYGVPQDRKRVFIVGVNKKLKKIKYEFPKPTHGPNRKHSFLTLENVIGKMKNWPKDRYSKVDFHGHYLTRNRKRKWNEPSLTIVASNDHVPLHPMGKPMKYLRKDKWKLQGKWNRRLSWIECRKIQALPPRTWPPGSLSAKYRVIGNAVPPPIAKMLVKPIVKFEKANSLKN